MQPNHSKSAEQNQSVPINLAAEQTVLGALIENDRLLTEVISDGLRCEHFALSDHRRIFEAIVTLQGRHEPIDYITVAEQLGNRQEDYVLIGSLVHGVVFDDEEHVLHHATIVRRKWRLRALLKIAEWLTASINETADPESLSAQTINKIQSAAL
jgi:replicative DNA helicase